MVSLKTIKNTLDGLFVIDGDKGIEHIKSAIVELGKASESLESVSVRGRDAADALLGCMFAIDMIIGKEKEDGR